MNPLFREHLLTAMVFTPLLWGIIVLMFPKEWERFARPFALVGSIIVAICSLILYARFDGSLDFYQFIDIYSWLPSWGVFYHVGVDGISLPLVMLTALMTPLAILGTWPSAHDGHAPVLKNERLFVFFVMMLETGVLGSFVALDLFLFYIFYEVVLIPMYFLIGIWGGQDRIYATVKFFLYTLAGSLLMLVAIFYLINAHQTQFGFYTAAIQDLLKMKTLFHGWMSPQGLLFAAFAIAFVIKVPMVPFHTWLPDAHVQAPTIGSVFLAAVLLKMGTYGILRFAIPLFPEAAQAAAPFFFIMGVIGIVYGALVAMVQTDFKKLVAYSSVSHMGYILLGLFTFNAQGIGGALYQMINHGIATGGLFLIVGFVYDRLHTRELSKFGGLARVAPIMAIAFLIVTLSSVALPGTNGFVGEFPILLGTFRVSPIIAALAGLGVIFGAVYMLKAYQAVMLGPISREENKKMHDLNMREIFVMASLTVFIFGIGFFPQFFFGKSVASIESYSARFQKQAIARSFE